MKLLGDEHDDPSEGGQMDTAGGSVPARRVLVVEDDDDIREVAQVALQMVGGWQVITAGSGHQAIEVAAGALPDAILLDVMMPDLDGRGTIAKLKAQPSTRSIPVILLTAKIQSGDCRERADLDLAGVIAKPFDPMTLPARMSAMLGWSR